MADQTRRDWVITISRSAGGLGTAWKAWGDPTLPTPLPPGVYLPSTHHLSHALMSAGRYHPVPPGSPTDYVRPSSGPFEPRFFSSSEFPVIRRMTQLLLGETSDESAVSQEVAEWIDLIVSGQDEVREAEKHLDRLHRVLAAAYYQSAEAPGRTAASALTCRVGLQWISSAAQSRHSADFLSLATEQQVAILESISHARPDQQRENSGTRFFAHLEGETIKGFYTSRFGLQELDFKGNAFYASSPGCQSD